MFSFIYMVEVVEKQFTIGGLCVIWSDNAVHNPETVALSDHNTLSLMVNSLHNALFFLSINVFIYHTSASAAQF